MIQADVTQAGIDTIAAAVPGATVTGEYSEDTGAWTWTAVVLEPTEEDPEASKGVSRQFAATEDHPIPSTDVLESIAAEIAATLAS